MKDTSIDKIGYIHDGLIDLLKLTFPDKCPDPSDSNRAVWIKTGAAQVIKKLEEWKYEQDNPDAIREEIENSDALRRETR